MKGHFIVKDSDVLMTSSQIDINYLMHVKMQVAAPLNVDGFN